jgi:hypothetical protein
VTQLRNEDIGDNEPIPLAEAAKVFFGGRLTKSALRTEAGKGNLEIVRIANKDFVTRNAIKAMMKRCTIETVKRPKARTDADM